MSRKVPTIAIIGRTNVGKSSLFNQLTGRRLAIVEDTPGVTRDRHYAVVKKYKYPFVLVDTGGLIGEQERSLEDAVLQQTLLAIDEAELILVVLDGLHGPHPHDEKIVRMVRESNRPALFVVNKTEKPSVELASSEFYALGVDDLHTISAAHNVGISELILQFWKALNINEGDTFQDETPAEDDIVRVAFLGKPNVGKSTLMNKILGEERSITSSIEGTTRDRIEVALTRDGREYRIIDTAGLRRKSKVDDQSIERYSNLRALRELALCDVAVLMLDASKGPPTEQDAKIAGLIHERGKALIIAVNKWDAVEKDHKTAKEYKDTVFEVFKFCRYAPVVFISALTGKRCPHVLTRAAAVYDEARIRIPTGQLNRILEQAMTSFPPPVYRGQPIKLFFATQIDVAPPTIVLFVNHPQKLNFSYKRYLLNQLRKEFPFHGSDVRLIFRKRTPKEQREKDAQLGRPDNMPASKVEAQ